LVDNPLPFLWWLFSMKECSTSSLLGQVGSIAPMSLLSFTMISYQPRIQALWEPGDYRLHVRHKCCISPQHAMLDCWVNNRLWLMYYTLSAGQLYLLQESSVSVKVLRFMHAFQWCELAAYHLTHSNSKRNMLSTGGSPIRNTSDHSGQSTAVVCWSNTAYHNQIRLCTHHGVEAHQMATSSKCQQSLSSFLLPRAWIQG